MKFALNIIDWQARAPGLSEPHEWQHWAQSLLPVDPSAPLAKLKELPMMTARRLSSGSKLAVECGMALLRRHDIGAILFSSRHGELERNFTILDALAHERPLSPTDFAMSVHNAAVGNLTIVAQQPLVSSSLSAGIDTFQQGLLEALCLIQAGYTRVLYVDFDGVLPAFYHPFLPENMPTWPWAVALVIEAGDMLACETRTGEPRTEPSLPQSMQFLTHLLAGSTHFSLAGERMQWHWSRQ
ncbi:beta-ketoacyl synthase chain length factor [Siccibacter turicensis]|uniref:beta-ketoacyl synthase chain length factor n=1 Tax=Siccibacter turicensis TaxID=357233 RepID=UPI001021C5C7|nr:beta-ketoacyl synthase chain length factor [Siccibacter turicensis]